MAFPIAWAVGSFVGGLLAKEFYDDVIADNCENDEEEKNIGTRKFLGNCIRNL